MRLAGGRNSLDFKMLVAVTETSLRQRLLQIREHGEVTQKLIQTNRGIGYTFTCSNAALKLHPSVASASAQSAAASTASNAQSIGNHRPKRQSSDKERSSRQ
jgi:hypothetical protein